MGFSFILMGSGLFTQFACSDTQEKGELDLNSVISEERPGKRSEIFGVTNESSNAIMIFGGNNGPVVNQYPRAVFLEDTWLFQPGEGWTEVQSTVSPSARGRYSASPDHDNNRAIIFGGRWRLPETSGDYTLYNDLWEFDFESQQWNLLDDGTGIAPTGRYYPASGFVASTGVYYIWGGAENANPLIINPSDELWAWTEDDGWVEQETSGTRPSQRAFFGNAFDTKRNRIIVFGGQIGDFQSQAYHDLFALDVETGEWTELHDGNGTAPSTRMHPHISYDPVRDVYLSFGGHTDLGDGNDMWAFDPNTNEWSLLYEADIFTGARFGCLNNQSEVPADYVEQDLTAPERRHRGMHANLNGSLWLFGGIHSECSDHLDDTWRYDIEANSWHEIIPARTGESCMRRGDACECLCF